MNRTAVRILIVGILVSLLGPLANAGGIIGAVSKPSSPFWSWRLTGPGAINDTASVGIGGTDLGHMVNHNGKTYFLFGDTFSGDTPSDGGNWRQNAMAYSTDTNPFDGIIFDGWITDASGQACEVIHSGKGNPIGEIPTGGVSTGGRIYAWYMAVSDWEGDGENDWDIDYAGLAYWQEGDPQFTVINDFEFDGEGNFGMVAASLRPAAEGVDDEHVYIWGTPSGRWGGVKLARVMPGQIEDRSQYEFFDGLLNGTPQWTADEFEADLIVEPAVSEMSVMYNPAVEAWTMLYINVESMALEIRQANDPWGNWSDPVIVADGDDYLMGMYAPYMNPLYVARGGKTIFYNYSYWATYDVYLTRAWLTVATLPGDTNGDGRVDEEDAATLAANWGQSGGWAEGDFNGDGVVDAADASILAANWGDSASETNAVPEPGAVTMILLGALGLLLVPRRR